MNHSWYKLVSKSGNLFHSVPCPIFFFCVNFSWDWILLFVHPYRLLRQTFFSYLLQALLEYPSDTPMHSYQASSTQHPLLFFSSPLNRDQAPPNFPRLTQLHSASFLLCCSFPSMCLLCYALELRGEMPSSSLVRPALKLEVVQLLSCGIAFGFSVLFLSSAAGVTPLFSSLGWSRTASSVLAWGAAQYRCCVKPRRRAHKSGNYSFNEILDRSWGFNLISHRKKQFQQNNMAGVSN